MQSLILEMYQLWCSSSFPNCSKLDVAFINAEENWQHIFGFRDNSTELVTVNTHFYRERILVNMSEYSLKISDTTKKKFFELKFLQSYQKIWVNYCRADVSSVSHPLTCWLCISVLTKSFLSKYSKFVVDSRNAWKI